jgi:MFS family permease
MLIGIPATVIGGVIVPRHGLKKIAILSSWYGPCILIGYYFSGDWITLSIMMLLGSAGTIGSSTSRQLIADATAQKNRTAQLSLYQTLANIPSMFSPLIGGYLVNTMGIIQGFRLGVLIAVVASCFSTLLFVRFLRENNRIYNSSNPDQDPNLKSIPQLLHEQTQMHNKKDEQQKEKSLGYILRYLIPSIIRNRKEEQEDVISYNQPTLPLHFRNFLKSIVSLPKILLPLLIAYILVMMANSTTSPYYIFYATKVVEINSFQWGLIVSLQIIFANLVRTPLGMIADRFDKRKVLLISIALTAPLSTFFVFLNSFWGILGISLAMIATGIHYGPTHEALQIELTPRDKRPALFSIYDVLTSISRFSGVIIGGVLFAFRYTLPFYTFTTMEVCAFIILVISFLQQRKKVVVNPQ